MASYVLRNRGAYYGVAMGDVVPEDVEAFIGEQGLDLAEKERGRHPKATSRECGSEASLCGGE